MLAVNPNGNWYVQSARWGDVDALQDEINISSGGSLPSLEIVLRDDGGLVNGTVESDGSQARCEVLLVPDRNRSQVRTRLWDRERSSTSPICRRTDTACWRSMTQKVCSSPIPAPLIHI